jgi:pyruvate/2-oxoglutarate dehydrogenase complex dihydrolipoamide dehydrogenase (E3) component
MIGVEKDNTRGIATGGLTTGIIGTALGAMNSGILPGLFGGGCYNSGTNCNTQMVNRYEAAQSARIAELETEVKLRDANTFTMSEMGKLRDYVDRRFESVNAQLCQQAVINAQTVANISCMQNTINTLSGLTKTVIPITSVCPEPMPQYNSWTAPTATT